MGSGLDNMSSTTAAACIKTRHREEFLAIEERHGTPWNMWIAQSLRAHQWIQLDTMGGYSTAFYTQKTVGHNDQTKFDTVKDHHGSPCLLDESGTCRVCYLLVSVGVDLGKHLGWDQGVGPSQGMSRAHSDWPAVLH